MDETFLTKKKKVRGGFQGRVTAGHRTILLGFVEISLETRHEQAFRLIEIKDRKKRTIEAEIRKHVMPGTLIFTDKFRSYHWLSRARSGFVHRAINHRRREFRRGEVIFGIPTMVTTNSAEGLFGCLKTFLRQKQVKRVSKDSYGLYLAEFVWRATVLKAGTPFHDAGVWELIPLLAPLTELALPNPFAVPEGIAQEIRTFQENCQQADVAPCVQPPPPVEDIPIPFRALPLQAAKAPPAKRFAFSLSAAPVQIVDLDADSDVGIPDSPTRSPVAEGSLTPRPEPRSASPHTLPGSPCSGALEGGAVTPRPEPSSTLRSLPAQEEETGMLGGRGDVEGRCATRRTLPVIEANFCPQGHLLEEVRISVQHISRWGSQWVDITSCDVCHTEVPLDSSAFSCTICGWDVCTRCL